MPCACFFVESEQTESAPSSQPQAAPAVKAGKNLLPAGQRQRRCTAFPQRRKPLLQYQLLKCVHDLPKIASAIHQMALCIQQTSPQCGGLFGISQLLEIPKFHGFTVKHKCIPPQRFHLDTLTALDGRGQRAAVERG